jgi:hypothetical protein
MHPSDPNPGEFPDLTLPEKSAEMASPPPALSENIQAHPLDEERVRRTATAEPVPELKREAPAESDPPGSVPRVVALVLGIVGLIGCASFLLNLNKRVRGETMDGFAAVAMLSFLFSVLMTAGYLMRAFGTLPIVVKRFLWVVSIITYGIGSCCGGATAANQGPIAPYMLILTAGLYGLAAAGSAWALANEGRDAPPPSPEKMQAANEKVVIGLILFLFVCIAVIGSVFYTVRLQGK